MPALWLRWMLPWMGTNFANNCCYQPFLYQYLTSETSHEKRLKTIYFVFKNVSHEICSLPGMINSVCVSVCLSVCAHFGQHCSF